VKRKLRVYIAGAYSGPDVVTVLNNMRLGMKLATQALQTGMLIPFCPWLDYHFFLMEESHNQKLTVQTMYSYSMSFLEHWAEAVLVQPIRAAESKGTQAELDIARSKNLPIFYNLGDLLLWLQEKKLSSLNQELLTAKVPLWRKILWWC